jgi:hypothetical protein
LVEGYFQVFPLVIFGRYYALPIASVKILVDQMHMTVIVLMFSSTASHLPCPKFAPASQCHHTTPSCLKEDGGVICKAIEQGLTKQTF